MKVVRPTRGELVAMIVLALVGVAGILATLKTDWVRGGWSSVLAYGYTILVLSFLYLVSLRRERRRKE